MTPDELYALGTQVLTEIASQLPEPEGKRITSTINNDLLRSRKRVREATEVRQLYCWTMHVLLGYTAKTVSKSIGRDHSTCLHACTVVQDRAKMYAGLDRAFMQVAKSEYKDRFPDLHYSQTVAEQIESKLTPIAPLHPYAYVGIPQPQRTAFLYMKKQRERQIAKLEHGQTSK